jgi:hypothetical protein
LRGRFEEGDRLIDEAKPLARSPAARARVHLERGRLRRSDGDPAAAFPLFESAFGVAVEGGEEDLAADAAHGAWTNGAGDTDGWFHEELAEDYAALGRNEDAREQARLALPLLLKVDSSLEDDPERLGRLRTLAGEG